MKQKRTGNLIDGLSEREAKEQLKAALGYMTAFGSAYGGLIRTLLETMGEHPEWFSTSAGRQVVKNFLQGLYDDYAPIRERARREFGIPQQYFEDLDPSSPLDKH